MKSIPVHPPVTEPMSAKRLTNKEVILKVMPAKDSLHLDQIFELVREISSGANKATIARPSIQSAAAATLDELFEAT